MSWFSRLKEGLARTRQGLVEKVKQVTGAYTKIDEDLYEELEAVLIQADVGVETTMHLLDGLRAAVREQRITDPGAVTGLLQAGARAVLGEQSAPLAAAPAGPTVILVVGVNGVGKTTTIGKIAARYVNEGKQVVLGAADTFRAAAGEQLEVWAERAGAFLVKHQAGADPAAVAFDAVAAGRSRGADVIIIDTAGRLHTKANLMDELRKIRRVISRELPDAPHDTLLVLDATTGQNAVQQARVFAEAVDVTGLVLTKLDSSSKGGVVLAIAHELSLPVKLVGIGEQVDDLRPFDPADFVSALFG
jgi:fused signal recognition particle receptor